jgi:hypothetical protein
VSIGLSLKYDLPAFPEEFSLTLTLSPRRGNIRKNLFWKYKKR